MRVNQLGVLLVAAGRPEDSRVGSIAASGPGSERDDLRCIRRFLRDGFCTSEIEDLQIRAVGGENADMYGEITPRGFRTLAHHLSLAGTDVFVDCGSGLGRAVVQAASEFGVHRAIGIEFAPSRHQLARANLARAAPSDLAARVELLQGDCADEVIHTPGIRTNLEASAEPQPSPVLNRRSCGVRLSHHVPSPMWPTCCSANLSTNASNGG